MIGSGSSSQDQGSQYPVLAFKQLLLVLIMAPRWSPDNLFSPQPTSLEMTAAHGALLEDPVTGSLKALVEIHALMYSLCCFPILSLNIILASYKPFSASLQYYTVLCRI
ncbi:hypothetical protein STEG23_012041 [Scotinomys teguina]